MHNALQKLRLLTPYFQRHKWSLLYGGSGMLVISLLLIPAPLITKRIVDQILPAKALDQLLLWTGILIGLLLAQKYISYRNSLLFTRINAGIILAIRVDLFAKAQSLPLAIKDQFTEGYWLSRIMDDVRALQSIFANNLINVIRDLLKFIVGFGVLLWLDAGLTLLIVALLAGFAAIIIRFAAQIAEKTAASYEQNAQITATLKTAISLIRLCKLFSQETRNRDQFQTQSHAGFEAHMAMAEISLLNTTLTGLIVGLLPLVILGYGGYQIIHGHMTLGSLLAFSGFTGYLFGPAGNMLSLNIDVQQAIVSLTRIGEILALSPEKEGARVLEKITGIQFQQVGFAYPAAPENPILAGITLSLHTPVSVGIIGRSGCGKTTLLNLLSRIYDPSSGTIHINGRDIRDYTLSSLRNRIRYVNQEPELLSDTVFENICFGLGTERFALSNEALTERVQEAARLAGADFILDLPGGYHCDAGEFGSQLSIGQKARLAIARALIANPDVLILDEASANLDNETESIVLNSLTAWSENRMVIIISHRMTFIQNCDVIYTLDSGTLIPADQNHSNTGGVMLQGKRGADQV